jgi:high-affinity nickel permease
VEYPQRASALNPQFHLFADVFGARLHQRTLGHLALPAMLSRLYPWVEMVFGIVIAIFAAYLMIRAWTGDEGEHSHEIGSAHSHWFAPNLAGGMALAVLVARWRSDGALMKRWLPIASAGFMLILGLGIAGRALLSTGIASGFLAQASLAQANLPSFAGIVLLGLFLGMRHSTDPDHVIAVSTIASRERSVGQGAMIGVLWGVGHTFTIFVVGSAIILFGLVIPPRVGLSMEFCVALMLILLGVLNLTGAIRWLSEKLGKPGGTGGSALESPLDRFMSRHGSWQVFRPLVVGLVHGLAGSAAVALLVLSTIRSPLWAIAYLLVFGLGTVVGMMLMTSAMAIPVAWTGKNFEAAGRYLSPVSGLVSMGFGLFLAYQIGFVDGLFRAGVHWTPQ